jgi:hypothetical protein
MKINANTIAFAIMFAVAAFVLFTQTGFDAALSIISVCLDTLFETVKKI